MKAILEIIVSSLVAIVMAGLGYSDAYAADNDMSGNKMLPMCKKAVVFADKKGELDHEAVTCLFYLRGLWEGSMYQTVITTGIASFPNPPTATALRKASLWCAPEKVTFGQTARVVVKYMENHPGELHENTSVLAFASWTEAFPCK